MCWSDDLYSKWTRCLSFVARAWVRNRLVIPVNTSDTTKTSQNDIVYTRGVHAEHMGFQHASCIFLRMVPTPQSLPSKDPEGTTEYRINKLRRFQSQS